MHEFGLVEGIVEAVRERAGDRAVAHVRVRIGTLHHGGQGPMDQAFEMVTVGTPIEGATLELIQVPVTSTCRACGRSETDAERTMVCAGCGGADLDHVGGDELILESIEYRAPVVSTAGSAG